MTLLDLSILSLSELRMRKLWRNFYLFITVLGLIYSALSPFLLFLVNAEKSLGREEIIGLMIASLFGIICSALFSYFFYYCAYKKAGTRLLTFNLFLTPIFLVIVVIVLFSGPLLLLSIVGAGLVVPGIFYVLSWKLRKINKKLRLSLSCPKDSNSALQDLSNASITK